MIESYLGMSLTDASARVLTRARRYVAIETPSRDEAAITALATVIRADLESLGAIVGTTPVPGFGANLFATIAGAIPTEKPILAMAHIDTVHAVGTLATMPSDVVEGRAYGPGLYDMKAGLSVVIEAIAWLREQGRAPRRPLHLLITCDEEIGSHSVRATIEELAPKMAAVLVPEPCISDGGVKTFRKGVATYVVRATGRAAHAGIEGTQTVSATRELVWALNEIIAFADHDRGTTINIGTVAGGTASNVVAAEAEAVVDVRLAEAGEDERIHAAMTSLRARHPEATLSVTLTESRPPLIRTEAIAALYHEARELAAGLGVILSEGGTGGGSDGSLAAAAGAATLDGLGPQGAGAHAIDEHVIVADLPFRLALIARLLECL